MLHSAQTGSRLEAYTGPVQPGLLSFVPKATRGPIYIFRQPARRSPARRCFSRARWGPLYFRPIWIAHNLCGMAARLPLLHMWTAVPDSHAVRQLVNKYHPHRPFLRPNPRIGKDVKITMACSIKQNQVSKEGKRRDGFEQMTYIVLNCSLLLRTKRRNKKYLRFLHGLREIR